MDKETEKRELLKFMYGNVYDELNRSRDWPIKIMAFASGVDVAIYGLLKFNENCQFGAFSKGILLVIVFIVTLFTVNNILNQHRRYKEYRNIQKGIQRELEIQHLKTENNPIFPDYWTEFIPHKPSYKKGSNGKWGLGYIFYVTFIIALAAIAFFLIIIQ